MCSKDLKKLNFFGRIASVFGFKGDVCRVTDANVICNALRVKIEYKDNDILKQKDLIISKTSTIESMKVKSNKEHTDLSSQLDDIKSKYDVLVKTSNNTETKYNKLLKTNKSLKEEMKSKDLQESGCCVELATLKTKHKALIKENDANIKELTSITNDLRALGTATPVKGKLECDDIRQARLAIESGETIKDVAAALGVAASTLSRAVSGITYKQCKESGL